MRRRHIEDQRSQGRRALAVLPVHYPKELLTALDILAVELWGPPGPPRGPGAGRVQAYVCPVVRNATAFIEAGHADGVDGLLFPHTCDSVQGLATLAADFGLTRKPCFTFIHPKGEDRPALRTFLRRELRAFADRLGAWVGRRVDADSLRRAIGLHRRIDALRARLLDERRTVGLTDAELYGVLRRGEWQWPEAHLQELEAAVGTIRDETTQRGVPLFVTGYVPEPAGLLSHLEDAGAFVAADDWAAVGRRVVRWGERPLPEDPWDALVELRLASPPCSTQGADQARRIDHLERLYLGSGARGAILHMMKFCEPELFDLPAIRRRFERMGAPVLVLETELEGELSGQALTRLEAFVEMVGQRRAA